MGTEYIPLGSPVIESEQGRLPSRLLEVASACEAHSSFEVCEFRSLTTDCNALIVDVGDGTFDSSNSVGIRRVERLAVIFTLKGRFPWEVRALRTDFPVTMHQNHVSPGDPRSLCLYLEPWSTVERIWTPQEFLSRILWWLRGTAEETLHRADQPLEQLFFESPQRFVLPEDHFERLTDPSYRIVFDRVQENDINLVTFRAKAISADSYNYEHGPHCIPLTIILPPITHGRIEEFPANLNELAQKMSSRGANVIELLSEEIKGIVPEGRGLEMDPAKPHLILLVIGTLLQRHAEPETKAVYGFAMHEHFGQLGEDLCVLSRVPGENKWYRGFNLAPESRIPDRDRLASYTIDPVSIKLMPSKDQIREYSGISDSACDFRGVIAGLGALGSSIADIWARESWGEWEYVDHDVVEPHNLARHVSPAQGVGMPKSQLVSRLTSSMFSVFPDDTILPNAHVRKLTDDTEWLSDFLTDKDLVVDASTTLEVPRDLSVVVRSARVATIFMTPSGISSVLLLEDQSGYIRCLSLEAQYYRAILTNNSWGKSHLVGNTGHYWVGAGCRDVTVALSNELVSLHASLLARQLRLLSSGEQAQIWVWAQDDSTGAISAHEIPVANAVHAKVGKWTVWWDSSIERTLSQLRSNALPNETGGALVGFVDHKIRTISIVLAMNAPEDSVSSPYGFVRGIAGVEEQVRECRRRTGQVVSYIGEWHSHPEDCSSQPSSDDRRQLKYLSEVMARDGTPAIVLIVSRSTITVSLEQSNATVEFSVS